MLNKFDTKTTTCNVYKAPSFPDTSRVLASIQKKEDGNFKILSTSKHFLQSFHHIKEKLAKKGGRPTPLS